MASIQSGSNAANSLDVDPASKAARATLYDSSGQAAVQLDLAQPSAVAAAVMAGINDRTVTAVRTDRMGNLASALHTPLLHEPFEGGAIHATRWTVASTLASAQSTIAGLVFNSGLSVAAGVGHLISSTLRLMKAQRAPLQIKLRARLSHVNNAVMEFGLGDAATFNGAHTAGAYWQMTASGVLQPVVTFNGVDQSGADIRPQISTSNYYTFDVMMDDDEAIFVCQDTSTGLIVSRQSIKLPLTGQRLLSATALPVFARQYHSGTAPASAPQLIVTDIYALALDVNRNMPWAAVMSGMGRGALENPFTGAGLANYTNSTAPVAAVLSNTAGGYAATVLGGAFAFASVAGAETDYALFAFQVPVGANLRVTGIDIETFNTVAAVATTPAVLQWGVGVNQAALSLATAAPRALLGVQSFPVGAAIGASGPRISRVFATPLIANSGRWFVVALRVPVGSAGNTFRGFVNVEGYFE